MIEMTQARDFSLILLPLVRYAQIGIRELHTQPIWFNSLHLAFSFLVSLLFRFSTHASLICQTASTRTIVMLAVCLDIDYHGAVNHS